MQRAERRAQQDKWLALAQVGLNLMSSTQPTIGGALGEAGIAGLQSYQGARDEYETERLGLSKELAGIAAARASQRAAAAKASSGPTLQQLIDARFIYVLMMYGCETLGCITSDLRVIKSCIIGLYRKSSWRKSSRVTFHCKNVVFFID